MTEKRAQTPRVITPEHKKPGAVDENQDAGEGIEETNATKLPKKRGESSGMPGTSGRKGSRGTTDSGGFGGVG